MFTLTGGLTEDARDAILRDAARLEALAADLRGVAAGTAPRPEDLEAAPVLSHWYRAFRPLPCLRGLGNGHPRLRNGLIQTTDLWAIDTSVGWARTLSRWYVLGEPDPSGAGPEDLLRG